MSTPAKTKPTDAQKWAIEAIKLHHEFVRLFKMAKDRALTSGMYFLMAKESLAHGEWGNFIEQYKDQIPARTIRFYMEFTTELLTWARRENPNVTAENKLLDAARHMVMQSPKGLINLCRAVKDENKRHLMRPFGEYDEVKYREKKMRSKQIEFDFMELLPAVEAITKLGDKDYVFHVPAGVEEKEFYTGLEGQLETALKRVREAKKAIVDV